MNEFPRRYVFIGIVIALIGLGLEVGFGFGVIPIKITEPGSLLIKGGKFYADPLTPCTVGVDAGCSVFFQSQFRFLWAQKASNVMMSGITKELSTNWEDVSGDKIVIVATTDKDSTINYKLVQDKDQTIQVFVLIIKCD